MDHLYLMKTIRISYNGILIAIDRTQSPQLTMSILCILKMEDEFNHNKLNDCYVFLRVPQQPWYSLSDNKGKLSIQLLPATVSQK
jgi:hypothetical protein